MEKEKIVTEGYKVSRDGHLEYVVIKAKIGMNKLYVKIDPSYTVSAQAIQYRNGEVIAIHDLPPTHMSSTYIQQWIDEEQEA